MLRLGWGICVEGMVNNGSIIRVVELVMFNLACSGETTYSAVHCQYVLAMSILNIL